MSILTAHFSNLYMTPSIVKKLLGFKVNPITESVGTCSSSLSSSIGSPGTAILSPSSPLSQDSNSANLLLSSTTSLNTAASSPAPPPPPLAYNSTQAQHNKFCEKSIRALVKKLKKTPGALEELEKAITTRDAHTKCIRIPTKNSPGQDRVQVSRKTLPHVIYCRIWRWADLQNCNELKPVAHCQGYTHHNSTNKKDESSVVCINPYHYLRCNSSNNNSNINSNNCDMNMNNSGSSPSSSSSSSSSTTTTPSQLTVYVPKLTNKNEPSCGTSNLMNINPLGSMSPTTTTVNLQQSNTAGSVVAASVASTSGTIINQSCSSSSTTSSSSSIVQNDIPQLQQQLSLTGDLIQSSNYMITASPSPISILSPSSIASNAMSQQFSPFISEDDSSEINDISPSPLGLFDLMPVTMVEQPYWCSLSYYEMKQRVGEQFHVSSNVVTIDGYTNPSCDERFCLGVLSNVNRTNEVEMTRHYIGRGLMLTYQNGEVIAECLSENPVFVQSPNCNQRYKWHLATVVKIPPGCSLKIFDEADFVQVANETVYQGYEAVYALTRICTIRISFVKGWGAEYRRQTILNTPCWIEVHLNNPLKLVDQILTKMGSPRTKCTSFS